MGVLFVLLAILACAGLAVLFFGSLVAMLASLGNRKWLWFLAIVFTIPLASTFYSTRLSGDQRWLLKMLVVGWLMLVPFSILLLVILVDNNFVIPIAPLEVNGSG